MPSIPTHLHDVTFFTVGEAAERYHVLPDCIYDWISEGVLTATKCGRSFLIPSTAISRVDQLGTDTIRALLRHSADDRIQAGGPDLEAEARESATRAHAHALVAKAKLRQAQRKDLAALDAKTPPRPNTQPDGLPEIRELNPLRVALIVRELGSKPVNKMTDAEIFELKNRLDMVTAIPAVDATSGNQDSAAALAALREQGGSLLDSGNGTQPAKPYTPVTWSI